MQVLSELWKSPPMQLVQLVDCPTQVVQPVLQFMQVLLEISIYVPYGQVVVHPPIALNLLS